jgi:hypothetical protein
MAELRPIAPKPGTDTCWSPTGSVLTMVVDSGCLNKGQRGYILSSGTYFYDSWKVDRRARMGYMVWTLQSEMVL